MMILGLVFWVFFATSLLAFAVNGLAPVWLALAMATVLATVVVRLVAAADRTQGGVDIAVPAPTLAAIAVVSLAVITLSGVAGFFYINLDWQVRLPLLRDLANNPWPVGYRFEGTDYILRTPVGLYVLPALLPSTGTVEGARVAMLIQNAGLMAAGLAIIASVGRSIWERAILVGVVLGFSGLDQIAVFVVFSLGIIPSVPMHELSIVDYTSTITQAFWVPHNSLPGLILAGFYLRWRLGLASPAALIAFTPLMAFWSPMVFLGALPFATHAMVASIIDRRGLLPIVGVGAISSIAALYGIVFITTDTGGHGWFFGVSAIVPTEGLTMGRALALAAQYYLVIIAVAVLPFALIALASGSWRPLGASAFALVLIVLVAAPLVRFGPNVDLAMRATIPSFILLAITVAFALTRPITALDGWRRGAAIAVLITALATPVLEIRRAIARPLGEVHCHLVDAWRGSVWPLPNIASYIAREVSFPSALRPRVATRLVSDPAATRCFSGSWP